MRERILFLHAIGGSAASWKRQLAYFPGSLAIDLTEDSIEGMAEQAGTQGPAHIVGLSMGGVVALQLAKMRPEKVRSLTLVCAWSKHPEAESRMRFLEESLRTMTLEDFARGSRSFLLAPDTPDDVAEEVRRIEASKDPRLYAKQWRAMYSVDLSHVVPKVPVLLIGASLDRISPVESCLKPLHVQIPRAELRVIQGANHFVNIDRPDECNEILSAFLEEATHG